MLDVELSSLQRLMHFAVFASAPCSSYYKDPGFVCHFQFNYGFRPRRCRASARTNESCSLSSANAARSAFPCSDNWPSLLRSINC